MSGPPRWVCPGCGYDLAPRMTRFADAEHRVHHREAAVLAAQVRHRKIPASEWRELVDLYRTYSQELRAQNLLQRAKCNELEDRLADADVELDEERAAVWSRDQLIDELYADLDRQLG